MSQLCSSETEELVSSVERYDIFKYDASEDHLDVWAAGQKFVRESIEAGTIKGSGAKIDDTAEKLIRFIESSAPKEDPIRSGEMAPCVPTGGWWRYCSTRNYAAQPRLLPVTADW